MTLEELAALFQAMPEPAKPFYRLYYNPTDGCPLFYSMEDRPGTYIEISQTEYHNNNTNVRIRDGKIIPVTWQTTTKLIPGESGTPCHPNNVAVVVTAGSSPTGFP